MLNQLFYLLLFQFFERTGLSVICFYQIRNNFMILDMRDYRAINSFDFLLLLLYVISFLIVVVIFLKLDLNLLNKTQSQNHLIILLERIISYKISKSYVRTDRIRFKIVNVLLISFCFILLGNVLFFISNDCYYEMLPILLALFSLILLYFSNLKKLTIFPFYLIVCCSFLICFYSIYYGLRSGVGLYYICLIMLFPLLFDLKRHKVILSGIVGVILIQLLVLVFFEANHVIHLLQPQYFLIKLFNFTMISFLFLAMTIVLIFAKRDEAIQFFLIELMHEKKCRKNTDSDTVSAEKMIFLKTQVVEKNYIFLENFRKAFPVLTSKLEAHMPIILQSEYQILAYLRLNYSTKEIAHYTKSSVRSVESRIYRIRKKMKIPSHLSVNEWISYF